MKLAGNLWNPETWKPMNKRMEMLGFKNTSNIDVRFYSTCPPIVIQEQRYVHTTIDDLSVSMQPKLYGTSSDYLKVHVSYRPTISDIQFSYTKMKRIEEDKDFVGLIERHLHGFEEIIDWFRKRRLTKYIPCSTGGIHSIQFDVPRYPKDGYGDKTASVYFDELSLTVDRVAGKKYLAFNVGESSRSSEDGFGFCINYLAKSKEVITPIDFYRNVNKIVRDKNSPVRTIMSRYKENIKVE